MLMMVKKNLGCGSFPNTDYGIQETKEDNKKEIAYPDEKREQLWL